MPCEKIAAEIEKSLSFLTDEHAGGPGRHESLRSSFESSYRLLSGDERRVFRRLSVFRGGFMPPAALLPDAENMRLAWERAATQGCLKELSDALPGLSHYYSLGLLEEGRRAFGDAADRLAALDDSSPESARVAGRLRANAADSAMRRGLHPDLAWSIGGGTGTENGATEGNEGTSLQRWCLNILGGICWSQEDLDGAVSHLEQMRDLAVQTGNESDEATALGDMANIERILDHLDGGTLNGVMCQSEVYLACYEVLSAVGDPRAGDVLEDGYRDMLERADRISDEGMRASFLNNVRAHRAIAAAWEARAAGPR